MNIKIFIFQIFLFHGEIISAHFFNSLKQCDVNEKFDFEGQVSDCACDFKTVNVAVQNFFSPLLSQITSRIFFRYFRVNLERPCPYWDEDGQCSMEGCSVCACDEKEIPTIWLSSEYNDPNNLIHKEEKKFSVYEFGWISNNNLKKRNKNLEGLNLSMSSYESIKQGHDYMKYLRDTEDADENNDWCDLPESKDHHQQCTTSSLFQSVLQFDQNIYVNLLQNHERHTGYGGPSARRVWDSILKENCFGGDQQDTCIEKRVFYRLMSGLQSSISTHIAREYYFHEEERWQRNVPLFMRAVGNHRERVDNLYFTFLFLLRAVVKAGNSLVRYDYSTGNSTDAALVLEEVRQLLAYTPSSTSDEEDLFHEYNGDGASQASASPPHQQQCGVCRKGYDESVLFHVSAQECESQQMYWEKLEEKLSLKDEFKLKFRNISRIMDCVSCDRCRVWGKLQILGIGTAIKILLHPSRPGGVAEGVTVPYIPLRRQEIIALINTLNQFAKSIDLVATVSTEQQPSGSMNLLQACYHYINSKLRRRLS